MPAPLGKSLVALGTLIMAVGLIIWFKPNIPLLGKLPGDIKVEKEGFSFYFPVVTCVVLSLIFSLVFFLISKLK